VLLGVVLALGVGGMMVESPESANADEPILFDAIYFPWVPNNDEINGTGPWHGSITVQNIDVELDNLGVRFWVLDGETINRIALNSDGEGDEYSLQHAMEDPDVPFFDLDANASTTLNPGILGLPEPGSPVAIFAIYKDVLHPDYEFDRYQQAPVITGVQKQASPQPMSGASTTAAHLSVDGYAAIPFPDIAWGSQSKFCYAIADGVSSCDGTGLHDEPGGFDGHSYLPIVQSNSGWNTEIYLSNIDFTSVSAAQVSVTLTESGKRGSATSGEYRATETVNIPPGGTVVVDTRKFVGDEWVGSAHITSTVGISTVAMRSRPEDDMLMINSAAPSLEARTGDGIPGGLLGFENASDSYRLYAPLVFRDYHGWNTGISFVNISENPNRVSVTFVGSDGNQRAIDVRTVPPQGQEFIYLPATANRGDGFSGAAFFTSSEPFHVAIDQVKYESGEAMSYLATATGARQQETLTMPLVQKGLTDGSGDTSGLRLMNVDSSEYVDFEVEFLDSAGVIVGPSHFPGVPTRLGPGEFTTLYTPNISGMPQNQRSAAIIRVIGGDGEIVGVSNNVNYAVEGDGSTAFNLVNLSGGYRFPGNGGGDE
jgi:hypothetical protein